jgi:5-methylcytosine-specific restriction protein B
MANVWKIAPGQKAIFWDMCREKRCIVIGWLHNKDLREFTSEDEILHALKQTNAGGKPEGGPRAAKSIWRFFHEVRPSDVIVANKGLSAIAGIGVVKDGTGGDYLPPGSQDNPSVEEHHRHTRLVNWLIDKPINLKQKHFFVQDTVWPLTPEQCEQIKQACLKEYPEYKDTLDRLFPAPPPRPIGAKMKELLEQFGQVILYGPPGTGKTREAQRAAIALLGGDEPKPDAKGQEIQEQL